MLHVCVHVRLYLHVHVDVDYADNSVSVGLLVMAHYGLSSQQAQERLHSQLQHLAHSLVKVDWLRELRQPPYSPLVFLGTALASLILILDYSLGDQDGRVLAQACVLLLLAALNTGLFCWEVYIIKTRRIRRLLSKVKPYLDSPCPWNSLSYPSKSVNTLRGQCTVHAHRDGAIVNLPASLVVQGDVIELYRDVPSPAEVTLLDSEGMATTTCLKVGELPPREHLQGQERRQGISFVQEEKRLKFVVTQTPIIATFMETIQKKRPTSILTREKNLILLGLNITLVIALGLSFLFNLVRFLALPDDVGPWTDMLLRLQVYTALPLLHLPLSVVWVTVNLYGTAKIVLLTEKGPDFAQDGRRSIRKQLKYMWETAKQMVIIALYPSMYPNYRVFHILGSLTSLCSIDKEYVLTDSAPIPEKVFFLSRGKSPENDQLVMSGEGMGEEGNAGGEWEDAGQGRGELGRDGNEQPLQHSQSETHEEEETRVMTSGEGGDIHIARRSSRNLDRPDSDSRISSAEKDPSSDISDMDTSVTAADVEGMAHVRKLPKATGTGQRSEEANRLFLETSDIAPESSPNPSSRAHLEDGSLDRQLSYGLSNSLDSLATPFELVSEILDLSPNYSTVSGLCFDDINWEKHLSSLKPIGVNALAASHLLSDPYAWCPSGCTDYLRNNLSKTNCICPLGVEIGVTEYSQANFTNEVLLYSISDPPQGDDGKYLSTHRASTSLLSEHEIQPHLVSSVLHDNTNGSYLIMSRGSGDMIAACCSDFWDGKDLQPMTDLERGEIAAFYSRRHLTSYCVALAYNPLIDIDLSPLRKQKMGLYIPDRFLHRQFEDMQTLYTVEEQPVTSYTGEQVFNNLLCKQVFLGIVSLQFRPKADIVNLIEEMEVAGIRFVYFTSENEVQGKVFAEKLGLEAGWNCHISLAPPSEDEAIHHPSEEQQFTSCSTSPSSSLNSVINAFQSYIRAKLPKGIQQVRPHLLNVDNVPLLVPLFTDCTVDAIREMVEIMQENGEVVMCIGNSWGPNNLSIFAQADVSLSIIPEGTSLQSCPKANDDETLSTSISDNNFGNPPQQCDSNQPTWPTPLEMASYLNSTMCQLCCRRDSDVSIVTLVTQSRHIVSSIRHGLLFGLGSVLSLTLLMLSATILFLPPPLSGSHIFWLLLFTIPVLTLSFLSSTLDPNIRTQMPTRKKRVLMEKWLILGHFCMTFLPTSLLCLLLFALTLGGICSKDSTDGGFECHPLLGNRNDSSSWNGWRGNSEQGLWLAQDITAFFFTIYIIIHTIRFIHRTEPIWKLFRYVSWPYIMVLSVIILLQIVYFAISQTVATAAYNLPAISDFSSVPPYVWGLGLILPFPLLIMHELLKYHDKIMVVKHQRHLKLEFETKLGMNSPF